MKSWIEGTTPYPIVNAAMRQLKATGYQSNRARQLVASCLVNELGIDWRYGAAYFEEALIDFDLGSNWGNWQYLGGVGADPRGHRQFSLAKQTQTYDPEGLFIKRWGGEEMMLPIHRVDYHDWPIEMK
jgi:deoxyribodipyrimidine photo-lyase